MEQIQNRDTLHQQVTLKTKNFKQVICMLAHQKRY